MGRQSRKKEERRENRAGLVTENIIATAFGVHEDAIRLVVESNARSAALYATGPNDIVRDALYILLHDATIVHRSVDSLVRAGWSSSAAVLIRTLLDISVSAAAILRGKVPTLNAFRYFYAGIRRLSRDPNHPAAMRGRLRAEMRARAESLPAHLRSAAAAAINEKDRKYWFSHEWNSPKDVLEKTAFQGVDWIYQQLSAAAHGGFIGFRLFQDNPDEHGINPRPLGLRSVIMLTMSAKFLIEIVSMRNDYEQLDIERDCQELRGLLDSVQKLARKCFAQEERSR